MNSSDFLHKEFQTLAANSNGAYPLTTPITFKHDEAEAVGMFFSQLPPKRWPMSLRREQTMARLNDQTNAAKKTHVYSRTTSFIFFQPDDLLSFQALCSV